jgi:hypothetical protein
VRYHARPCSPGANLAPPDAAALSKMWSNVVTLYRLRDRFSVFNPLTLLNLGAQRSLHQKRGGKAGFSKFDDSQMLRNVREHNLLAADAPELNLG